MFSWLLFQSILQRLNREKLLLNWTQVTNLYQDTCLLRNLTNSFHFLEWFFFLLCWLLFNFMNNFLTVFIILNLTFLNILELTPKVIKLFFKALKCFRKFFGLFYIILAADSLASNNDFTIAVAALWQASWNYKIIRLAVWIWIEI